MDLVKRSDEQNKQLQADIQKDLNQFVTEMEQKYGLMFNAKLKDISHYTDNDRGHYPGGLRKSCDPYEYFHYENYMDAIFNCETRKCKWEVKLNNFYYKDVHIESEHRNEYQDEIDALEGIIDKNSCINLTTVWFPMTKEMKELNGVYDNIRQINDKAFEIYKKYNTENTREKMKKFYNINNRKYYTREWVLSELTEPVVRTEVVNNKLVYDGYVCTLCEYDHGEDCEEIGKLFPIHESESVDEP